MHGKELWRGASRRIGPFGKQGCQAGLGGLDGI